MLRPEPAFFELLRVRSVAGTDGSSLDSFLWQLDSTVIPQRSASIAIEDAHFRRIPPRDLGPHPAPCRQLVVVLAGTLEIATSDGNKAVLGPGGLLLAEDTDGIGHSLSSDGADLLVLPLVPGVAQGAGESAAG